MDDQLRKKCNDFVNKLLRLMLERKASDLFITAGFPPAFKAFGKMTPVEGAKPLSGDETRHLAHAIMNHKQWQEYQDNKGCNFAIAPEGIGRFRVNIFTQQNRTGMVLRTITTEIPDFDKMGLPPILKDVVMAKRGLVLLVGGTGSGKSTTLAALINHRNMNSHGHIITIEDPVEYVHPHKNCIITHREVGVDCNNWHDALKDTLRQAPDVILIGEIRDHDTMEYAINFAETGHLAMATLHANNANQALDRIINFFPPEKREQLLMDLSLNVQAIVSQRLIPTVDGKRAAAIEILLASSTVRDLIFKGEVGAIKEAMAASKNLGMQTFDQALFDLLMAGKISYEEALKNADAVNNLRLRIKLEGGSAAPKEESSGGGGLMELSLEEHKEPEEGQEEGAK